MSDRATPMFLVDGTPVVRLRPVKGPYLGVGHVTEWIITHPRGRRMLDPKRYMMRSSAKFAAEQQGWRVMEDGR